MHAVVVQTLALENKIGFAAHVGGLCAKGNDSWGWLGAFVFDCRRCSCVWVRV